MDLVFFGSFQHYSTRILQGLAGSPLTKVAAVITTPPKPSGRRQQLTPTHTHTWAVKHNLPVYAPETLDSASLRGLKDLTPRADFFLTAGYGKLFPLSWLKFPRLAPLNCHFSILPKFRGANPAEWAILLGEKQTGISLIIMDRHFDTGSIIAQATLPITTADTRQTLYHKLYALAADRLPHLLQTYSDWCRHQDRAHRPSPPPQAQPQSSPTPQASVFTRQDGFIPWECISDAIAGNQLDINLLTSHLKTAADYLKLYTGSPSTHVAFIDRAIRALSGYPGVWTIIDTKKGRKRLKIHSAAIKNHRLVLNTVQLESKTPTTFTQLGRDVLN